MWWIKIFITRLRKSDLCIYLTILGLFSTLNDFAAMYWHNSSLCVWRIQREPDGLVRRTSYRTELDNVSNSCSCLRWQACLWRRPGSIMSRRRARGSSQRTAQPGHGRQNVDCSTQRLNDRSGGTEEGEKREGVEFYLYPTVGTVLIHSAKPELTE